MANELRWEFSFLEAVQNKKKTNKLLSKVKEKRENKSHEQRWKSEIVFGLEGPRVNGSLHKPNEKLPQNGN